MGAIRVEVVSGAKGGESCERLLGTVGILAIAVFDGEVAFGFDEQPHTVHVLELRRHVQRGQPYAGPQVCRCTYQKTDSAMTYSGRTRPTYQFQTFLE